MSEAEAKLSYRVKVGARTRTRKFGKSDQFAPELMYFSGCILNGREPEPSGDEGLTDVRIIEGMNRSMASGRWVALKARKRTRRPTMRQEIRSPAVPKEPKLVNAKAASQ